MEDLCEDCWELDCECCPLGCQCSECRAGYDDQEMDLRRREANED